MGVKRKTGCPIDNRSKDWLVRKGLMLQEEEEESKKTVQEPDLITVLSVPVASSCSNSKHPARSLDEATSTCGSLPS